MITFSGTRWNSGQPEQMVPRHTWLAHADVKGDALSLPGARWENSNGHKSKKEDLHETNKFLSRRT